MALDRTMLRDRIKDLIIERILDGTYGPGERILEMTIATELGTSQGPVREALRDLEAMRFIESIPYRGARVRAVTTDELLETYPVRAALESLAGSMAASMADDELFERLDAELEAMRECARLGDLHEQMAHDARFHEAIVEAAGNQVLLETWRSLRIEARTLVTVIRSDANLLEVAETHAALVSALRSRDPLLVATVMREHIEGYARSLAQS